MVHCEPSVENSCPAMDSPTISTASAVLIANIGNFSKQISKFVACYRGARREMDAVSREISSLTLCLETIRDDSLKGHYTESMRQNLIEIICKCNAVSVQLLELLRKLSSDDSGNRSKWTVKSQNTISNQTSSLAIYRSALDIALDMSTILVAPSILKYTDDIQSSTAVTEQAVALTRSMGNDGSQIASILDEIGLLRVQISHVKQHDHAAGVLIDRFLQESEIYVKSSREANCLVDLNKQLTKDSQQPEILQGNLEIAGTAIGLSKSEAKNKQLAILDGDRASFTDTASNASTSATEPSPEAVLPQSGSLSREVTQPALRDIMNEHLDNTAKSSTKAVRRKPVSYCSAPELDLRGVQDALQLDYAARDARALAQNSTGDGLVGRSLPLEFSTNPLPQANLGPLKPNDSLLIPVEIKSELGKVDYAAIDAAAAKWVKLPANKQLKLSKHLETLIRGKRDILQGKGFWVNEKVGSFEEIKKALDLGARPNSSWGNDRDGFPLDPLLAEMRNAKRREVIELLLSRGARADNLDKILVAAFCDNKDSVELLLNYGADVEARDKPNNSPLSYAAGNGSFHMVKLLLDRGADVNGRAGTFGTALQAASQQGNFNTVQHLLDRGADVNAHGGFYGNALQAACWWRHSMVVQLLLEDGADVNALGQYGTALRAVRVSNAPCGEQQTRQTINLLIAYGAVDEKQTEKDLEIRPMLPPRPSANSAPSGQPSMVQGIRWA